MTEIETKEARWKELQELYCRCCQEMGDLEKSIRVLRLSALLETDLLSQVQWQWRYGLGIRGREIDGFSQLLKPQGYHDRFESDGWTLSFDDYELSLGFSSVEIMVQFIKNHNLKVDFKHLRSEIEHRQKEYMDAKTLAESLGA